ncbi:hypothetical protein E4U21_001003 [Claviceps maximensis]|nr:hypothetical protein E4U21_001003 [Claviceps maximensis]
MPFRIFGTRRRDDNSRPIGSASTMNEESQQLRDLSGTRERNHPLRLSTTTIFGDDELIKNMMLHEKCMSLGYMFEHYREAMIWAALMAAPIFVQGYAKALLSSFFSYEPFIKTFGNQESGRTEYTIPTPWQTTILLASACGQLIGLWVAPYAIRAMGYRKCISISLVLAYIFTTVGSLSSHAGNPLALFLVSQLFIGVALGLMQCIILPYISDITPTQMRAPAAAAINLFLLAGQFVSIVFLRSARITEVPAWSVEISMLLQWVYLLAMMKTPYLAPESPLYLVQKGHDDDEAQQVLRRLHRYPPLSPNTALSVLKAVDKHEEEMSAKPGLLSCFRGVNLRRTEIVVMATVTQQCVAMPLVVYPIQLLQQDRLSDERATLIALGLFVLFTLCTLCSMPLMRFVGRRTLWLTGLALETAGLLAIGGLAFCVEYVPKHASLLMAYPIVFLGVAYHFTTGPVCYAIVAETPASRLKVETNTLAWTAYVLLSVMNTFLLPLPLDSEQVGLNFKPCTVFSWAGTAAACLLWAWYRLPEMKDRTSAEIGMLFDEKVAARKWHHVKFEGQEQE